MDNMTEAVHDVSLCIVHLSRGERISGELARYLNLVDPTSIHEYHLPAKSDVELHYHDVDEYWVFLSGSPTVTLRSTEGKAAQFRLQPGDMVACPRGVEHTLWADHHLVYLQFSSARSGGEREGHLVRSQ